MAFFIPLVYFPHSVNLDAERLEAFVHRLSCRVTKLRARPLLEWGERVRVRRGFGRRVEGVWWWQSGRGRVLEGDSRGC